MNITYDASKNATNLAKHGVSLALAEQLEWESAVIWPDLRKDYGEPRCVGLGYIGDRLFTVVFVDRDACRRIISLRKANQREERIYAKT